MRDTRLRVGGRREFRRGRLRGWMKTGAEGSYTFTTVRPAPYPGRDTPAHIHPVVEEPGTNEHYIDEYVIDDDPLFTRAKRSALESRGGSGIVRPTKSGRPWAGRRDVVLGLNVPGYGRARGLRS